ncbi:MAG: calcium-binding protein [Xenococcaceae cyanobacterium MO_234.B1]|nr:calcium-binding protein [Xenococcaceae cyanobacterium MO_234.B1]
MLSINDVFNESYYLEINPEAAEAVANEEFASGLEHFQAVGIDQGLQFTPLIDLNYYKIIANPDISELSNREALDHLLETGIEQGRLFSPFIELDIYKEVNPELSNLSNTEAFIHLQDIGINEGLQFSSFVDLEAFRLANPTLATQSNFDAFVELSTFYAPPDEGQIRVPMGVGFTIADAVEIITPEMLAGSSVSTITYSKSANKVIWDLDLEGLPFRLDVTRTEDASTPFNQFPVSVEDGKWRAWLLGELNTIKTNFWYDGATKQLIGNEFDIFDDLPFTDTPIDVNGDGVEDIPVSTPSLQAVGSALFEGNPDGTAQVSFEYNYDQILDYQESAGFYAAVLPYNLEQTDALGIYYTQGGLPTSEAMSWDDILANIRGGAPLLLAVNLEPDPQPDYLVSRDNRMPAFTAFYPNRTPEGIVFDLLANNYQFAEPADLVTHENEPFPARILEIEAETEQVFGNADDSVFDAADPSDEFDGNRDTVFAGAGADLVDASQGTTGRNRLFGSTGNDEILTSRGDRAFGGTGSDLLDASVGSGKNRLYGGEGNDELLAGTGDRLFAGASDDILDATTGSGDNRLYGQDGNDIFFLGSGDRLLGGDGDDAFFVTDGGDNLITGGIGADAFWIATGELITTANTITDFELDADVIGVAGIGATSIDDLEFSQVGNDAVISFSGFDLVTLLNTQASALQSSDAFVFA